ncbi:C45 family autoproteolytic acyltransferase/hydolase [Streptomyces prasinopilosus]|uniref:Acyl-coenzyme A:6-aminopenicillanic acid acyl-transferase n=1 Tax=Streptomyces prasinopilosus TaxID=67344 RepID=A0A1G6M2W1_9ACTN|nr:C45 family peptidase [Streptomyces prasinopilosus]SDC49868.1 Acyl-coenzyme A:6-aminopenicillanic acid acyl-transferase [Streptomyces prasinopilosus]
MPAGDRPLPYVRATGSPFALGVRHGTSRAKALRAFLDDGLTRLNHVLSRPVTMAELGPRIAAHRAALGAASPDALDEIRGLAHGAGLTPDEALLLQIRREIMGYRRVPTAGDCTTYAVAPSTHDSPSVLAQTVDLNGHLDDQICVLDVGRTDAGRRSLLLSFGGLLGYLGINSEGLAVGINLVLGGVWEPGLPPYLAVRHLLDQASDVDSAVAELRRLLPLASSRSFTLCDPRGAAYVELCGGDLVVVPAVSGHVVHTNHFLHPDLAHGDALNPFARRSSLRRLEAASEGVRRLPPSACPEEHLALLSTRPIRVPDRGDIRAERTVAAVVMVPSRRELHIRPGDPALSATQVFRLNRPFQPQDC